MAVAGRVAIVPKGEWSANATYKRLDAVTHNNTLYFAKKNVPAGTVTSNTEYWSKSIVGGASAIATTEDAGVVKPDGKSMSVDESGTLSINLDGATITLDEAKNVIKLADTLKDKIGSALQPESIVNNQITTEEGFALDARQANPNIDGSLAKQVAELNGSLKTYVKRWYIDIATNEDKYYEVFSYTAEKDCFVFICAETYYTSPQPLGLKISVESSIYAGNDDSYQIISKIESNNYNEIATSCNVYVRSGRKIKIEERISSTGHLTGGVAYQVVPV